MAHDVFISYSTKDKTVADAVCATLESKKIRCWIAPRDVLPGMAYAEALVNAIHQSRIFVLVFSASANDSSQVMREVERAVNQGIPIIPFRIENVMPSGSMEYFLSTPHWLDALTTPLEKHLELLTTSVQAFLGRTPEPIGKVIKQEQVIPTQDVKTVQEKKNRLVPIIFGLVVLVVIAVGVFFLVNWLGSKEKAQDLLMTSTTSVPTSISSVSSTFTTGITSTSLQTTSLPTTYSTPITSTTVTVSPSTSTTSTKPIIPLPTGVIAVWHFDEGIGSTTIDGSGNNYNGTADKMDVASCWVDGKLDKALKFDGVDDRITISNSENINMSKSITVEFWVKSGLPSQQKYQLFTIMEKSHGYQGITGWYFQSEYDKNAIGFGFGNGSIWYGVGTGTGIADNTWHHIAGTFDGTEIKIYLDGTLANKKTTTGAIAANTGPIIIGAHGLERYFNGIIDEVYIYNIALSADIIAMHAQGNYSN